MKLIPLISIGCLLLGFFSEARSQDLSRYTVIPWPQPLEARNGAFALDSLTQVALSDPANDDLRAVAAFWAEMVRLTAAGTSTIRMRSVSTRRGFPSGTSSSASTRRSSTILLGSWTTLPG